MSFLFVYDETFNKALFKVAVIRIFRQSRYRFIVVTLGAKM